MGACKHGNAIFGRMHVICFEQASSGGDVVRRTSGAGVREETLDVSAFGYGFHGVDNSVGKGRERTYSSKIDRVAAYRNLRRGVPWGWGYEGAAASYSIYEILLPAYVEGAGYGCEVDI